MKKLGHGDWSGIFLGAVVIALLGHSGANAAVVHVNVNAPAGGNGASWGTAYNDLATALGAALTGDEIWLAAGTYSNLGTPFQMTVGVALYGGFAGVETALSQRDYDVNVTELDGQGTTRIMEIPDAAQPSTVIDGVTFRNGYHFDWLIIGTLTLPRGKGGAIYSYSGSPTLRHCKFLNNQVNQNGAVIYDYNGAPIFEDCLFSGNVLGEAGGVGYLYNANFTMINCVLENNSTLDGNAGAIYAYSNGNPKIYNSLFVNNKAQGSSRSGGAIYRYGSSSNPVPLELINCTFANNSATGKAGALYDYYGQTVIANTIIYGNTAPSSPSIYNSSSYPNGTTTYSCIEGGFPGTGNIAGPPGFVAANDFHVTGTSPCLDAGDNTMVPAGVLTDLDGEPRFVDEPTVPDTGFGTPPIVDMGAYELSGCPFPTFTYGTGCAGSGGFVPSLSGTTCATIGQQFDMTFSNGLGGAVAYVFAGLGQGSVPLDPYCDFLLTPVLPPLFAFPLGGSGPGNGAAVLSFAIPMVPVGLSATVQYFTQDIGAPSGISGSNALKVTFNN